MQVSKDVFIKEFLVHFRPAVGYKTEGVRRADELDRSPL